MGIRLTMASLLIVTVVAPVGATVLCRKRSGIMVTREMCRRRETQVDGAEFGAAGLKGDKGDRGDPGQAGPPGPPGPTASGSARRGAVADLNLTSADQALLALSDGSASGPMVMRFDGRVFVSASVTLAQKPNAAAGKAECRAQIKRIAPVAEESFTALNTAALHSFPTTGSSELYATIPVAGSIARTAGTYDVRVVCRQDAGSLAFRQGDLVVWAVAP